MQALFPWGQCRARQVSVPPPSALSLPKAAGAHLARVWQRRPKTKFVLCIRDPAYTERLGRRWLCSPHGRGHSNPAAPRPSGKPQTCTHAHTRTRGKGGSPGAGKTKGEGGEGSHLPKTMSAPSQEKCVTGPVAVGSTEVPRAALPHAQAQLPWHNAKQGPPAPCQQPCAP